MSANTSRRPPLRWRKQPSERGLARICQGARGWDLQRGGEVLAQVRYCYRDRENVVYFYASVNGINYNSLWDGRRFPTVEAAKDAAKKWVREREKDGGKA